MSDIVRQIYIIFSSITFEIRELFQHVIKWRQIHFQQFVKMLMIPAEFQMIVPSDHSFVRMQLRKKEERN